MSTTETNSNGTGAQREEVNLSPEVVKAIAALVIAEFPEFLAAQKKALGQGDQVDQADQTGKTVKTRKKVKKGKTTEERLELVEGLLVELIESNKRASDSEDDSEEDDESQALAKVALRDEKARAARIKLRKKKFCSSVGKTSEELARHLPSLETVGTGVAVVGVLGALATLAGAFGGSSPAPKRGWFD